MPAPGSKLIPALIVSAVLAGSSPAAVRGAGGPADAADLLGICGPHWTADAGEAPALGLQPAARSDDAGDQDGNDNPPPLFDNLGDLTWPVTTRSETAQRYVDQGLRLTYAFNHAGARRAFRAAQDADPDCAMCYWGEAYVLGPNINAPMVPAATEPALTALGEAQKLAASATPKEQALIGALAKRYSPDPRADRKALDAAYADAMAGVAASFPDDDNVQTLYAETLMDLSPWDYWADKGATPKGQTPAIIKALETVLARHPDHPGAEHLYIHAVEASSTPQRGVPYADRLPSLMPGSGHMVHMSAHIYFAVGRYKDAIAANIAGIKTDEAYYAQAAAAGPYGRDAAQTTLEDIYRYGYYGHNLRYLLNLVQMSGDGPLAVATAEKLDRVMAAVAMRKAPRVQEAQATLYLVHARFSAPDTILALPEPADALPYVVADWRYARAVAYLERGKLDRARAEVEAMAALVPGEGSGTPVAKNDPTAGVMAVARQVVNGRIALAEDRPEDAIAAFREAATAQDRLPSAELPYWTHPVWQQLAAVQLAAGRTDDAIESFRASLARRPNDAYALYGLAEALRKKGLADEATQTEARFRADWTGQGTPDLKAL